MKCLFGFYNSLYTSKTSDTEKENYLENVNCERFTEDEEELCDKLPTILECEEAVHKMKKIKLMVKDGLTSEFYKTFWHDIKKLFYSLLIKKYRRWYTTILTTKCRNYLIN